jgi:hypothetical protein
MHAHTTFRTCRLRCSAAVHKYQAAVATAVVVLLAIGVTTVAWSSSAATHDPLDRPKFVLAALGTYSAMVAFIVGLLQYRTAQRWKRAEFVATEAAKILQDPRAEMALKMIDWSVRTLKLKALDGKKDDEGTVVTMEMQAWALTPHTLTGSPSPEMEKMVAEYKSSNLPVPTAEAAKDSTPVASDSSTDGSMEGKNLRVYSGEETIIRDCYDKLLDGLDRMGSYLESGLLKPAELLPYFEYWIEDMVSTAQDDLSALWNVCLFTYTLVYGHKGTIVLFAHYGHDVTPDGEHFAGFVEMLRRTDTKLEGNITELERERILKRRAAYLKRALELQVAATDIARASPSLASRVEQLSALTTQAQSSDAGPAPRPTPRR